jgi:hypothetical protein
MSLKHVHVHDRSLVLLGTGTAKKSGEVKQIFFSGHVFLYCKIFNPLFQSLALECLLQFFVKSGAM